MKGRTIHTGSLVLFSQGTAHRIGRVETVRSKGCSVFPWLAAQRRFDRRRSRVNAADLLGVLPAGSRPAELSQLLEHLREKRDRQRARAMDEYREEIAHISNAFRLPRTEMEFR